MVQKPVIVSTRLGSLQAECCKNMRQVEMRKGEHDNNHVIKTNRNKLNVREKSDIIGIRKRTQKLLYQSELSEYIL